MKRFSQKTHPRTRTPKCKDMCTRASEAPAKKKQSDLRRQVHSYYQYHFEVFCRYLLPQLYVDCGAKSWHLLRPFTVRCAASWPAKLSRRPPCLSLIRVQVAKYVRYLAQTLITIPNIETLHALCYGNLEPLGMRRPMTSVH